MTPLEKIKALTPYTDDAKINIYIEMVQDELKEICKLDVYITELDNVLVDMVIVKLNKAGNEGVANISMSGISETYLDEYPKWITNRLKKYTHKVVMR
jgi:hypothetical protein